MLVAEVGRHLAGLLELAPGGAGLQCVGWLPPGVDDHAAARAAAARDIDVSPVSMFAVGRLPRRGLLLNAVQFPLLMPVALSTRRGVTSSLLNPMR